METVAAKERDMSELVKSIGDIQRSGKDREEEAAIQRKAAEERATAAEGQLVECREKLSSLGYAKKSLEDALEVARTACATHESTIANLQSEIATSRVEHVEHDTQLQHERDLRSMAEEKANEERAERIALNAQLNAQLREHALLRESMEDIKRTMMEQIRLKDEETKNKDVEITKYQETITALEAHQQSLKQSLSNQTSMLASSKDEEIGNLKGEIANLESRLKSEVEKLQSTSLVSEAKVQELEEIIRKGQVERKR